MTIEELAAWYEKEADGLEAGWEAGGESVPAMYQARIVRHRDTARHLRTLATLLAADDQYRRDLAAWEAEHG